MRNQSSIELPAVYVEAKPFHDLTESFQQQPVGLEIYDVTYLHFHNVLEVGFCVAGEGICYVEDHEYPFSAGDVQVIFPFQRHLSRNATQQSSRWHWLSIDPMKLLSLGGFAKFQQADEWLSTKMSVCGILHPDEYPLVANTIQRIIREAIGCAEHRIPLCSALLYELIIELCRVSEGKPRLHLPRDVKFTRLSPALDAISAGLDCGELPKIPQLAGICQMSVSTFQRAFQSTIGTSPKVYMRNCAMRKAQQLLMHTGMNITEISQVVGFEDVSGFNRCFMERYAITPSEFRRHNYT